MLKTFDQVRIINLPDRADRRSEILRELARLGLVVDGQRIAFHPACRPQAPGGFSSIGARGCFLSHLSVLEQALDANSENVLILEDDVDFVNDVELLLPAALVRLSHQPWDIFYGGYSTDTNVAANDVLSLASPDLAIGTTHLVAFSRRAMAAAVPFLKAMLARQPGDPRGGPMHVDGAYCWLRASHPELQTWLASPELGCQRSSRSDIYDLGLLDRTLALRPAADLVRRTKRWARRLRA